MKARRNYLAQKVTREDRADGSILLRSAYPLGPVAENTGAWLHSWAREAPDRTFVAERHGAGWRSESYAATLQQVLAIAASLLARGLTAETPILILSGNGVDHALLVLAAQYVGIPAVPVAEQYSLIPGAHSRLLHAVEMVRPGLVYAVDAGLYGPALALDALAGIECVTSRPGATATTPFADLLRGDGGVDVAAAHAAVGPDTVAKILLTSGSTSAPKGVLTTQRMMCVNQTQIADALPFLRDRPPVIVDWLPWNHVFGGSHNFNMILSNGGSLYIDDGKPVKGPFARTLENLSLVTGTIAYNVPVGFAMLLGALRNDATLRQRFFADLDMLFYAGASLPQDVWEGLEQMATEVSGAAPLMTSSWGLTETAPAALLQHEPTRRSGIVGVPLNGVTVKLIPDADMRCDVRVAGPNIMPGYFNAPGKTAEAFDEEGFFITGDAMRFVEADNPSAGLRFDGRLSEDFKLLTGTWVRASALRLELLACLAPYAADLVVTGQDRSEIGVLIFPNRDEIARQGIEARDEGGLLLDARLAETIAGKLAGRAAGVSGASSRVDRALVLSAPASMAEGEITAKGNLNFRRILDLRADLVARLYDNADPALIRI